MSNWTDERIARLKVLWAEGLSASQIAGELRGISRNAVIGKVFRLGLPGRAARQRVHTAVPSAVIPRRRVRGAISSLTAASVPRIIQRRARTTPNNLRVKKEGRTFEPDVVALPSESPEPFKCRRVTLMKRTEHQCGWIIGATAGPKTKMCGAKKEIGVSYCAFHAKLSRGHSAPEWTPERRAKFLKSTGIGAAAAP